MPPSPSERPSDHPSPRSPTLPRLLYVAATVIVVVAVPLSVARASGSCWLPPVPGRVIDEFRAPACAWCPGNRGLEYLVPPGSNVRAVAAGVVTYSGSVAGTRYVVVDIGGGRLITYGRLSSATVRRGDRVAARSRVGRSSGTLFFGLRVYGSYTDPAPYLGVLVGRPRLVPIDGSAPRPAPPGVVRCGRRVSARPRTRRGRIERPIDERAARSADARLLRARRSGV